MKKRLWMLLALGLLTSATAWAQRTVTGTVLDNAGEALAGVSIQIKGTTEGTQTDFNGKYSIKVKDGQNVLVFSFIGMAPQEVTLGEGQTTADVTMLEDAVMTEEIVITTALGISKEKRALGYAVQEVGGEQLAEAKEVNVVNALQGNVAGVQIQGTTGAALGGSSRITIRGANSFGSENQPLFVVDGMPINNDNYATADQSDGFGGGAYDYGNAAADINPNDIASMQVLKGAAATALYGTRGANGVILITTKSGSKKGLGVEVSSSFTFDEVFALIEHQQKYGGGATLSTESGFQEFTENGVTQYAPIYSKDGSWGPRYDPNRQVRHWDSWDPGADNYGETRPWIAPENGYEEFFETGTTFQNSVALSGGNENGSFRLSYTNLDQSGVMPNSDMMRNTVSINAKYNLSEKLEAFAAGSLVVQDVNGRSATGYANNNPMQGFTQWWQTQLDLDRLQNIFRSDGSQYTWNATGIVGTDDSGNPIWDPSPFFFDNPYWVRSQFLQEDTRDRFFGNFGFNYKIIDGLTFSGRFMRDGFTFQAREATPVGSVDQSSYSEITRTFRERNLEFKLAYSKDINEDISLSALVGTNFMKQGLTTVSNQTNGGLALAEFYNISNSLGNPISSTFEQNKEINSVFGTATLGLWYMLYVDLSLRGDWSSTLPEENNNYWYPSVTGSFVFSELPAIASIDPISFGKIRVGYGAAAIDAQPYSLANTYAPVTPNFGTNPRYAVPNAQNNPNLRPEFTSEFEVGLEMQFLDNRIGLDLTYYNRLTKDLIFNVASSAATGYTSRAVNAGNMRNRGIELMLNATPVKVGDFKWDVAVNFATFDNEVVELAEGVESIRQGSTWAADVRLEKGQPYMALYGQKWERNENGDVLIDENGFPIATEQREFLGSAIPDFTGGIRNTFTYKNISLSALIDFQEGGVIHSTSLQWAKYSGMAPETAEGNIREEGFVIDGVYESNGQENVTSVDPQTYYQSIWRVAEPNVYEASFVKFRELKIGYRLPNALLEKTPIRDVQIGFLGRNLAIISSDLPFLDPQGVVGTSNVQGLENAQIPSTRSYGFNLSFKF
ncbi:MAG: SusC/RagA family TonB-linked outer membrane protein [Bacteroidota bacterium]